MRLTANFSKHEFDSKDGSEMPENVLKEVIKTAKNLQVLRDHLNRKITINSGYRSPEHNKRVGGKPSSQHLLGTAADIVVEGITPTDVFAAIEKLQSEGKMEIGGLKAYPRFVHYDRRGRRARW